MFVAGKIQKVQRGGTTVELQPGDPFPEAETAPMLRALINTGYAVWRTSDKPGNAHDDAMMTEAYVRGIEKSADEAKKSKKNKPKAAPAP